MLVVDACPVKIDPLSMIMGIRHHFVLDKADIPAEWTTMFTNIENNGAPWKFPPSERGDWSKNINQKS